MRREKRKRNTKRIMEAIEKGKSLKNIMNTGNLGKSHMIALNSKDGKTTNNRDQIVKITGEFYKNLYTSRIKVPQTNKVEEENVTLDITADEVRIEEYETWHGPRDL